MAAVGIDDRRRRPRAPHRRAAHVDLARARAPPLRALGTTCDGLGCAARRRASRDPDERAIARAHGPRRRGTRSRDRREHRDFHRGQRRAAASAAVSRRERSRHGLERRHEQQEAAQPDLARRLRRPPAREPLGPCARRLLLVRDEQPPHDRRPIRDGERRSGHAWSVSTAGPRRGARPVARRRRRGHTHRY